MDKRPIQIGDTVQLIDDFTKNKEYHKMGDHRRRWIRDTLVGQRYTAKHLSAIPGSGGIPIVMVDVGMFYGVPEDILEVVP